MTGLARLHARIQDIGQDRTGNEGWCQRNGANANLPAFKNAIIFAAASFLVVTTTPSALSYRLSRKQALAIPAYVYTLFKIV